MHNAKDNSVRLAIRAMIHKHLDLLGHEALGVTELRVFDPLPRVAYADSTDAAADLCLEMDGKPTGVYVGVQPRPAHLFDLAPNRWVSARGGPEGNCACDSDIEYITAMFFDIDVLSNQRQEGHPASKEELKQTLRAAQWLARQDGLALSCAICCSGNGHYVLAPVVPISVATEEVAGKFASLCRQLADSAVGQFAGVRIDAVYNLSRVMRVMGTVNRKGEPLPDRPYRRAQFVTEPLPGRSMMLHCMIVNQDVNPATPDRRNLPEGLRCSLNKIEQCEFIRWCRRHPQEVSEPAWFALISNLAHLQGGIERIHEISQLDNLRYDYVNTQRVIERVLREGYKPASCRMIMGPAMVRPGRSVFECPQIGTCRAKAPMYLATSHTIYTR